MPPPLLIFLNMATYAPQQRISWKDISQLMVISQASAQRYVTEIKTHFNTKVLTYNHYARYFNIE